ncbi:uncharacterized protein LOC111614607 [Centruroides sculpturatus]|uniref:uncharacterized protein LOC111614607 n=1 Tax=Centruroides sculpturatus TaxID=218467 RepID=UPI000C6CF401|nr:uncharacterized protein LOC111614607 [Centruroides sculpturatus]XP_023211748.1 uncharacterized protein LOC111614607 [Centruroides sculpturatus]
MKFYIVIVIFGLFFVTSSSSIANRDFPLWNSRPQFDLELDFSSCFKNITDINDIDDIIEFVINLCLNNKTTLHSVIYCMEHVLSYGLEKFLGNIDLKNIEKFVNCVTTSYFAIDAQIFDCNKLNNIISLYEIFNGFNLNGLGLNLDSIPQFLGQLSGDFSDLFACIPYLFLK